MINIRKFPSVKTFMKRISGLVSVLQSIEVFSTEIRQLQNQNHEHETPGGDDYPQEDNSFNNAQGKLLRSDAANIVEEEEK